MLHSQGDEPVHCRLPFMRVKHIMQNALVTPRPINVTQRLDLEASAVPTMAMMTEKFISKVTRDALDNSDVVNGRQAVIDDVDLARAIASSNVHSFLRETVLAFDEARMPPQPAPNTVASPASPETTGVDGPTEASE